MKIKKTNRSEKLTPPYLLVGSTNNVPDIQYISGFTAPDPVLLLVVSDQAYLLVSALEKGRAQRETKANIIVLSLRDLRATKSLPKGLASQALALLAEQGITKVRLSSESPVGLVYDLQANGITVELAEETEICSQRAVKTQSEIKAVRYSQKAATKAMHSAYLFLKGTGIDKEGYLTRGGSRVCVDEVRRVINRRLLDYDCFSMQTIVAGGRDSADPHRRGAGFLKEGQPILIDIFPRHAKSGYWGDISRTFCRGDPSRRLREMYAAVAASQEGGLRMLKPGITGRDVHNEVKKILAERGFKTDKSASEPYGFIHGTGHGVGLDIHEMPRLNEEGGLLQAGNIVTVEPGLYYPEIGGVRIEDTVLLTPEGWESLAPYPVKMLI